MAQKRSHNRLARGATTRSRTAPATPGHGELTVTSMSRSSRTDEAEDPFETLGSEAARARRAFYLSRRS